MTRYLVTYCVMDGETGTNPFWHAALLLSKQESENAPITVNDAVGYYSQPSSTTNYAVRGLKWLLGLDMDLQNTHGILKKESMRYIDGNGLHGVTFEVSETQFNRLQTLYTQNMASEESAIMELNEQLRANRQPLTGPNRFAAEKARVAASADTSTPIEPRLRPFHIAMTINSNGLDTRESYTCKNHALSLLLKTEIIDNVTHDAMIGGPSKHAFPRFGVDFQPFRLVSDGEPEQTPSNTGKYFFNRTWANRNTLHWASPPYIYGSPLPKPKLAAEQDQLKIVKNILTRTRKVEILLRQKIRELPEGDYCTAELQIQLGRVSALYSQFRVEGEKPSLSELSQKAVEAEKTLNVATLSITPERVDYSFMLRASNSLAVRNGLIALMIAMVIAATFISTPVGAVLATTATLYGAHQAYNFFREDRAFIKMRADYRAYHGKKPEDAHPEVDPAGLRGIT